jgi:hypothetical protein
MEVIFTLLPLYPREMISICPFDTRLGGPLARSGRSDEKECTCVLRESNAGRLLYRPSNPGTIKILTRNEHKLEGFKFPFLASLH